MCGEADTDQDNGGHGAPDDEKSLDDRADENRSRFGRQDPVRVARAELLQSITPPEASPERRRQASDATFPKVIRPCPNARATWTGDFAASTEPACCARKSPGQSRTRTPRPG